MTNKDRVNLLLPYLDSLFPDAECDLHHCKDYEFLISVMLSAQSTDKSVNDVTPILFNRYDTLEKLSNAPISDIEQIIKPIGLYKNKAKNIKSIALSIQKRGGAINDEKFLLSLPGVGNKTMNVFLAEVYSIPHLAVDTHIERICKRLGLVKKDDNPFDMERKLEKLVESSRQIKTHHQLIRFGRSICSAKKPSCQKCELNDFCLYYLK